MASTYKHDYAAFRVEVLRAPFMAAEMRARAKRVEMVAVAIAPVDTDRRDRHRGRYKRSFHSGVVYKPDRVAGVVWNSAPEALAVEFGNRNTREHATLRRALAAAG